MLITCYTLIGPLNLAASNNHQQRTPPLPMSNSQWDSERKSEALKRECGGERAARLTSEYLFHELLARTNPSVDIIQALSALETSILASYI